MCESSKICRRRVTAIKISYFYSFPLKISLSGGIFIAAPPLRWLIALSDTLHRLAPLNSISPSVSVGPKYVEANELAAAGKAEKDESNACPPARFRSTGGARRRRLHNVYLFCCSVCVAPPRRSDKKSSLESDSEYEVSNLLLPVVVVVQCKLSDGTGHPSSNT